MSCTKMSALFRKPGHGGRASFGALLALAFVAGVLVAPPSQGANLQDIEVQTLPGQQVQLRLRLDGPAPEPLSFTIDEPARISLDLPNTTLALSQRRQEVKIGPLDTVLTAEASGRTRVVLNLNTLVGYETRVEGDSIYVTLGTTSAAQAPVTFAQAPVAAPAQPTAAAPAAGYRAVQDVDFRRGTDGAGRVIVTLSDPRMAVDVREEAGRVVVEFPGADLPDALMKRLDVLDFATPVSTIDVLRTNGNARVVVSAEGDFEQVAYQSDNLFSVEIKEIAKREGPLPPLDSDKVYTGERLTLNFQDIETRAVLQLLADISGLNVVVSDTVQGNVTLRLQNVPWDQALDIILRTKGLDMRTYDNVIIVAPAEEIAARERQELAARQELQELAPLRFEFIQVNYAKAADLADLIQSGGGSPLISERGGVTLDERTNTLLVQDTADKLEEIRRLVTTLDVPVRQVLIESRIVVVNDDYSRDLGVRLGLTAVRENGAEGLYSVSGSAEASNTIVDSALENLNTTGQPFPVDIPTGTADFTNRYNVNLPVTSPAGRIALAILDSDYLIDLELSALQAEGRGEIVSTPRVITANAKEASIEQGVEIPFQEASSSGATTTQFKKAVLALRVTPQITPDDRIIMDLVVSQDNVGEEVPSATGGFVPSIDTRNVVTQVLVNNGETVVLGGVYETERREVYSKVPFLGDIPGLGYLFRSSQKVSNKSELLIFVTPKILTEGANIY